MRLGRKRKSEATQDVGKSGGGGCRKDLIGERKSGIDEQHAEKIED